MPLQTKGYWGEEITTTGARDRFIKNFKFTGAKIACVRTDSMFFGDIIPALKAVQAKIYGWRWPHLYPSTQNKADDPLYWENEINTVTNLVSIGLDGYIFDIETGPEGSNNPDDWGNKRITDRATQAGKFATGIQKAFGDGGRPYFLGLTSHRLAFTDYLDIPWQPFIDVSSVLFPQTYWRKNDGDDNAVQNKHCNPTEAVTPAKALQEGLDDYAQWKKPIVPIGGEIGCAMKGEMATFATLVQRSGRTEAHFYVDANYPGNDPQRPGVDPGVMAEIKAA